MPINSFLQQNMSIFSPYKITMRSFVLLLAVALLFSSCESNQISDNVSKNAKRYEFKGKVLSVDKSNKKASIDHQEIPGFMDAMTMDFPIKEDHVFEDLTAGSDITAELVVDNASDPPFWLEKVAIISAPKPGQPTLTVNENVAVEGKEMPDFSLTNQDGKQISLSDFKGKTWALTFIYSECPLPNFCIAISKNFSDLANQIVKDEKLKDSARLLSISFDPKRDTPERLKSYGLGYLGKDSPASDFAVWQLAAGKEEEIRKIADFFGLRYEVDEKDKTQFNHSLRTAVISADGKVQKVFSGSDWTSKEMMNELKKSATRKE